MPFKILTSLTALIIFLIYGCGPDKIIEDLNLASPALEPYRSLHLTPLQGLIERNSDKANFEFRGCIFAYGPEMTLEGVSKQITDPSEAAKAEQTFKIIIAQFQDMVSLKGSWGLDQLTDGMGLLEGETLSLQFFNPGTNEHFNATLTPSEALAGRNCSSLLTPEP